MTEPRILEVDFSMTEAVEKLVAEFFDSVQNLRLSHATLLDLTYDGMRAMDDSNEAFYEKRLRDLAGNRPALERLIRTQEASRCIIQSYCFAHSMKCISVNAEHDAYRILVKQLGAQADALSAEQVAEVARVSIDLQTQLEHHRLYQRDADRLKVDHRWSNTVNSVYDRVSRGDLTGFIGNDSGFSGYDSRRLLMVPPFANRYGSDSLQSRIAAVIQELQTLIYPEGCNRRSPVVVEPSAPASGPEPLSKKIERYQFASSRVKRSGLVDDLAQALLAGDDNDVAAVDLEEAIGIARFELQVGELRTSFSQIEAVCKSLRALLCQVTEDVGRQRIDYELMLNYILGRVILRSVETLLNSVTLPKDGPRMVCHSHQAKLADPLRYAIKLLAANANRRQVGPR